MQNAQDKGAIGIIYYGDPRDYAPVPDDQLFPNGRWIPNDGVERGTVRKSTYLDTPQGDPLTAGYPAKGKKNI